MKTKTVTIKNAAAMKKLGAQMAQHIQAGSRGSNAQVIALVGDLGAGKTTLTQGFLEELGVTRRIISPTFLLMRPYQIEDSQYSFVFHIDCYRLEKAEELLRLGFEKILANPEYIVLIEWPQIMKKFLPKNTTWVTIEHPKKGTTRKVVFS